MEPKFVINIFIFAFILDLTFVVSHENLDLPILLNTTLDTKYGNNTEWKLPIDTIPKWFEYYTSILDFNNAVTNNNSCASVSQDFGALAEATGIWAVCQDPELPLECFNFPTSPCYPILYYDNGLSDPNKIRTIKISYAIYGMATIRLVSYPHCFDVSKRADPFSSCQFVEANPSPGEDGWSLTQFPTDPPFSYFSSTFTLEIISRFSNDVVILDKVEVVEYKILPFNSYLET